MTIVLYAVTYVSLLFFAIACVMRAVQYARLPIHLRWELYPVPHEEPRRVAHGGSCYETTDWWTRPAEFSLIGELKSMVPEMLFLKALREFNPALWRRSFAFHFGLYLLIGTALLLVAAALLDLVAPALGAAWPGLALGCLLTATGVLGVTLAMVGALGLLHRRLTDRALRTYTTPGDVLNLALFLAVFGTVTAGYLLRGAGAPGAVALARGLLTFDTSVQVPAFWAAGLLLGALLVAYIPLTHMSHFIAKYFTYHAVRWDDAPVGRNAHLRARMAEYLTYRPTWSAPHVGANGSKTWADITTANPAQDAKK